MSSTRKPYGSRKPPQGQAFRAVGGPEPAAVQVVACRRCGAGWGTSNRPWCCGCLDHFDRVRALGERLRSPDAPAIRVCKSRGQDA
jgi:hypothetical protein